jgi:DNA methylase
MNRQDAEEYTQSLGQIVAGSWRQIALAKRLGVPKALGLDTQQWVQERLGGYIRMSVDERREAVKELAANGESTRSIGSVLGVHHATVERDLAGANAPQEPVSDDDSGANAPLDAIAALAADEKVRTAAKAAETRQANESKRKANLQRQVSVELPEGLHHGDFRKLSQEITAESVDLIFTDPPYDAESIPLFGDAAREAARILKPGGSFIAYCGQTQLPYVLPQCAEHLRYWWTIAGVHSGGNQMLEKLGIRCGWKPLVWFVKDTRGDVQNVLLDVVSGAREKDVHRWQQAEEEALYYIEHLVSASGLVVDFFLGGGTTAVAANKLGRRWIGFEQDAEAAERTTKRLAKAA